MTAQRRLCRACHRPIRYEAADALTHLAASDHLEILQAMQYDDLCHACALVRRGELPEFCSPGPVLPHDTEDRLRDVFASLIPALEPDIRSFRPALPPGGAIPR